MNNDQDPPKNSFETVLEILIGASILIMTIDALLDVLGWSVRS